MTPVSQYAPKQYADKRGFTLAELLIVVAIIAVLAAIAIPIFNTQLEKARRSATVANIRSAYAEASASALNDDSLNSAGYTSSAVEVTTTTLSGEGISDVNLPFSVSLISGLSTGSHTFDGVNLL